MSPWCRSDSQYLSTRDEADKPSIHDSRQPRVSTVQPIIVIITMTTPSKQGRPNVLVEMRKFFGSINGWVARSRAGSYFRLSGSDHVRGVSPPRNTDAITNM